MANNIQPIWKDYYISFNTADSPVNYSIRIGGEAVFYGKAWCPPAHNKETYTTKINQICENYLNIELDGFEKVTTVSKGIVHFDAIKTFQIINDDTLNVIDEVTFVYDYSYDDTIRYNMQSVLMNKPVNNRIKEGMYTFQTNCQNESVYTLISKTKPLINYYTINDCKSKYALYYLNSYGGWDSYLIEGYVSRKDSFSRKDINRQYDNNTIQFGTSPYKTEITENYELHTGWMNEKESEIMCKNIFPSTRVYLHNLETDKITPVTITDADALYKTKNNTGRKLINYTINIKSAQTKHNKN
jgi:hypothetical protein